VATLGTVSVTKSCRIVGATGVLLAKFWGSTELEQAEALGRALDAALRDRVAIALMVVIEDDTALPSRAVRERLSDVLSRASNQLSCFAGVVLGSGLAATSKRTMMRIILTFARIKAPTRVFDDVEDAASWLAWQLAEGGDMPYQPRMLLEALASDEPVSS
jgi:hypothetical protein